MFVGCEVSSERESERPLKRVPSSSVAKMYTNLCIANRLNARLGENANTDTCAPGICTNNLVVGWVHSSTSVAAGRCC